MYSRVKERHKARLAALSAKDEEGDSQSEEESEEEEEEDGEEGEEEEEDDGQENRRVLRKRKTRPPPGRGGGGGGGGKSQSNAKGYSFRTRRAPTQFYQEPAPESRPRTRRDDYLSNAPDTPPKRPPKPTHVSPAYRKTLRHRGGHVSRTRRATHRSSSTSSSSSSSSSAEESSDEKKFQKRKAKSMKVGINVDRINGHCQ